MTHIKRLLFLPLFLIIVSPIKGDEGMWMLPLTEQLNIQKMHNMGCSLTLKTYTATPTSA